MSEHGFIGPGDFAAGVVVPILQRFGPNPILGYLVAGVAVGPFGLVTLSERLGGLPLDMITISDPDGLRHIAELGVIFLLFIIRLELSEPRFWATRGQLFGRGGLQVTVTAAILAGAGVAVGLAVQPAIGTARALLHGRALHGARSISGRPYLH